MKKILTGVFAIMFLFVAISGFSTTVRDNMDFKGSLTKDGADVITTTNTKTLTNKTLTSPTINSPTITSPTVSGATMTTSSVTQPKMTYGFTSYAYTTGSGAAYSVADSVASPTVYKITGGSGSTTFVMSYTGTAASNAGKMFYIINSSSNTVTFKQSGATGVSAATKKIITVIGNGTDFERVTADQ